MSRALFDKALAAARDFWMSSTVARRLAPWPGDIRLVKRRARTIPAIAHVRARTGTLGACEVRP